MKLQLTPRLGYLAGFLACAGLLAFSLYLQYYEYQNPCPLCILQRVAFIALLVVFLALPSMTTVQAPHEPRPQPKRAPFSFRSLRNIYSSGVSPSASTRCALPLTVMLIAMHPP